MKFLKALLIIVLILVIGYFVACIFGPKRMEISAEKMVDAPQETVYTHVAHLPTWEKWNTYSQMEGIEITYADKQEGEGASYSWTMEGEPGGNLKIVEANPSSSLRVQLEFANWDGYSYVDYKFQPQGNSTKVSWNMTNDSDTPFYLRGMMLAMEGSMKADFNKSLEGLEELSEANEK